MNENTKAKLSLIISMFVFGTIGIVRIYVPLSSGLIAISRGYIGAVVLILLIVLIKKQKIAICANKSNLFLLCLSGGFIGINWILLFESYQYTSVATATLCYYMAPVFVVVAAPFLFKEKITLKKAICVAVALVGMVLVSGIIETGFTGVGELKGILLGLGAALFYASVIVLNKKIKNVPIYEKTIVQLMSAATVLVPYSLLVEDNSAVEITPLVIIMLAIVGVVHTGISYALYFGSIEKLNTQTVAIFSYIDPIVAIILSAVILSEKMSAFGVIGAILILGSTMVSVLTFKKKQN
ncbi:MAG: EamA family transporter [Clostridia bacterium]|nr:EamA family transporter [Clostridia bacterium]